jgi:hypothetical protein
MICLLLISFMGSAQTIELPQAQTDRTTPWLAENQADYEGVYQFRFLQSECELILLIVDEKCLAQLKYGIWNADSRAWTWHYENLPHVSIQGNILLFGRTQGEFVYFHMGRDKRKGIKVQNPWIRMSGSRGFETGVRSYSVSKFYPGRFPQVSFRLQRIADLKEMSPADLRIMRNEIFARYGYIFKTGGEMEAYFKTQSWYRGQHIHIDHFLTELEKENIRLILQAETSSN